MSIHAEKAFDQIQLQVLARVIRQEKEIKGNQIRRKDFTPMEQIPRNLKKERKKTKNDQLELGNEFSKVERYKINNAEESIVFLYTSNEQMTIKDKIPCIATQK
jgi:hypothetical protein